MIIVLKFLIYNPFFGFQQNHTFVFIITDFACKNVKKIRKLKAFSEYSVLIVTVHLLLIVSSNCSLNGNIVTWGWALLTEASKQPPSNHSERPC